MTNIRPHHLLCMRAFIGKGYSEAFTENMRAVISKIQNENELAIVFHSDDICAKCPHLKESKRCKTEASTLSLDNKVIHRFKLQERAYSSEEISLFISDLTNDDFARICSACSWYSSGICAKNIFNHAFEAL